MTRLTIIMEDYDNSTIVRASLVELSEEPTTFAVLERSLVMFAIEDVSGPLFHYRFDDHKSYIDLDLRTKTEIKEWIDDKPFAEVIRSFLESESNALRLTLDRQNGFVEINRQRQ